MSLSTLLNNMSLYTSENSYERNLYKLIDSRIMEAERKTQDNAYFQAVPIETIIVGEDNFVYKHADITQISQMASICDNLAPGVHKLITKRIDDNTYNRNRMLSLRSELDQLGIYHLGHIKDITAIECEIFAAEKEIKFLIPNKLETYTQMNRQDLVERCHKQLVATEQHKQYLQAKLEDMNGRIRYVSIVTVGTDIYAFVYRNKAEMEQGTQKLFRSSRINKF